MARATTKQDLTESANGNYEKLWQIIDFLSEDLLNRTVFKAAL